MSVMCLASVQDMPFSNLRKGTSYIDSYVRMTNKMHTFLYNLFYLNCPRHVSNK